MKKSFYIIGGIVIAIAVIAVSALLILTDAPEPETIDISGIWKVYRYREDTVYDEYMVFEGDKVYDYRGNFEEPFISSTYRWKDGIDVVFDEVDKEFYVKVFSENNIILIEPDSSEWKMFRVSEVGLTTEDFDPSHLVGSWTVTMHSGNVITNETIEFTETTMTDYRDGSVYAESEYSWNDNGTFNIAVLGQDYEIYSIDEKTIVLLGLTDGYLWELVKN